MPPHSPFISHQRSAPVASLNADLRLYHDLGIDGDDAVELLQRYSKEFDDAPDSRYGSNGNNVFNYQAALGVECILVAQTVLTEQVAQALTMRRMAASELPMMQLLLSEIFNKVAIH